MSINQLVIGADVERPNTDTLGISYTKDTGLYPCTVDMAYLGKSRRGATSLNLHLKLASDQSVIRQTLWVTSNDAKGNKNYYTSRDGKKFLLPGMVLADQIALICTGKPMGELSTEEKTIKLWDYDAGGEKPTPADVVTELLGQPILVALMKHRENRRVSDGSGNYVPTADVRIFNEIDKVFYPDGFSVTEREANAADARFHRQWADKYPSDYVEDNYDASVDSAEDDSLPEAVGSNTGGFDFS